MTLPARYVEAEFTGGNSMLAYQQTVPLKNTLDASELLVRVEQRMHAALETDHSGSLPQMHSATHSAYYHLESGGRRARAQLAIDSGLALTVDAETIVVIAAAAELIHNASLVHDDLQDNDAVRRGKAAVWAEFGSGTAVCTGDLMLSAAYGCVASIQPLHALPTIISLLQSRIGQAIAGQCADISFREHPVVNIDQYASIVAAKSGALLSLPIEMVLIVAGASQRVSQAQKAAHGLAVGYQILDDLEDVDIDAALTDAPRALNILSVLTKNGQGMKDARSTACNLARHQLTLVDLHARRLPSQSGRTLLELAAKLRAGLDAHCT
jgi:geranylgeranyl pyrophosphate synthase